MTEYILTILIGLLGGVAVGFLSPLGGAMGNRLGGMASSVIVHLSGLLLSGLLLFLRGGENIRDWHTLPWYMLGAGIFGVVLYQTTSITFPRLGGAMMMTLIIIGQLLVGLVIDHFGLIGATVRHIDLTRIAGLVVIVVGGYLMTK
jgi:bacterial/archaeal transporter family-2 protein